MIHHASHNDQGESVQLLRKIHTELEHLEDFASLQPTIAGLGQKLDLIASELSVSISSGRPQRLSTEAQAAADKFAEVVANLRLAQ